MRQRRTYVDYEYFGIDLRVVWKTVHQDLPPLRVTVAKMLADLESGERSE